MCKKSIAEELNGKGLHQETIIAYAAGIKLLITAIQDCLKGAGNDYEDVQRKLEEEWNYFYFLQHELFLK